MDDRDTDRELLEKAAKAVIYNPRTGDMTWKPKPAEIKDSARWNARYAGRRCGTLCKKGYLRILFRFDGGKIFRVRAHRLAWFIYYGVPAREEIDHINQVKTDNRIVNLRDVSRLLNARNGTMKGNNTSGYNGVTWHKDRKKWCAQANVNGKRVYLGLFEDKEEAYQAAKKFRLDAGFTENHGNRVRAAAAMGEN